MKDARIFLGRKIKQKDFLGCEKRTKGFFWVGLKKVVILVIKICEWGPWAYMCEAKRVKA